MKYNLDALASIFFAFLVILYSIYLLGNGMARIQEHRHKEDMLLFQKGYYLDRNKDVIRPLGN